MLVHKKGKKKKTRPYHLFAIAILFKTTFIKGFLHRIIFCFPGNVHIIEEYMPFGSLLTYLRAQRHLQCVDMRRESFPNDICVDQHILLSYAQQIALGMMHLAKLQVCCLFSISSEMCYIYEWNVVLCFLRYPTKGFCTFSFIPRNVFVHSPLYHERFLYILRYITKGFCTFSVISRKVFVHSPLYHERFLYILRYITKGFCTFSIIPRNVLCILTAKSCFFFIY